MPLLTLLRKELRPVASLAAPVVVAEVGWVSMQLVDIAMVGRLGPEAIGAVGVGSALFLAFGVFGMGLLLGLDTLVSQAHGAGARSECRRWLRHGLWLALGLAVPIGLTARAVGATLDTWGFDYRVLPLVRGYFDVVTLSLLPLLLYAAFRRYLQAVARVAPVMVTLVTANGVNAFANWVLVFGNLGAPALGVEGAAWATCISRTYMAGVLAVVAARQGGVLRPLAGVRLAGFRRLLALGWPAATQTTLEYGAFAAVTLLAARLDPTTLAAHQIVTNVSGLTFMVPLGISAAGAVRVGHAVGRRDAPGASAAGWSTIALGAGVMTVSAALFLAAPRLILGTFTPDGRVVGIGLTLIFVAALFQIFDGLQVSATGALRGLGDTRTPMRLNLAGHWMCGLPIGYTLCFVAGWGVIGLWIGILVGLALVGALLLAIWRRRERDLPRMLASVPARRQRAPARSRPPDRTRRAAPSAASRAP